MPQPVCMRHTTCNKLDSARQWLWIHKKQSTVLITLVKQANTSKQLLPIFFSLSQPKLTFVSKPGGSCVCYYPAQLFSPHRQCFLGIRWSGFSCDFVFVVHCKCFSIELKSNWSQTKYHNYLLLCLFQPPGIREQRLFLPLHCI